MSSSPSVPPMSGMPGPPPAEIVQLVVPLVLGAFFNWALYGALLVQTYNYYVGFPKDQLYLKILVYSLFILETAQTVLMSHYVLLIVGFNFGNFAETSQVESAWLSTPLLASIISGTVQLFFARRIYVLSQSWVAPLIVTVVASAQTVSGIVSAVLGHISGDFRLFHGSSVAVSGTLWVVTGLVADVLIAGCMIYYFTRMRTGFSPTQAILTRLTRLVIETGTATAVCQLVAVVLFFAPPDKNYYLVPAYILGKLYSNNLVMIQNSRAPTSSRLGSTDVSSSLHVAGRGTNPSQSRISDGPVNHIALEDSHQPRYSSKRGSISGFA